MVPARPGITSVRKLRMGVESDLADREFWLSLSANERVLETWRLTVELWEMKGWDSREPGRVALLRELSAADARYLIVGAYALAHHARPRSTGDLDIWVDPSPDNAARVYRSLAEFGAPLTELSERDLTQPDLVFQIGLPPRRIDILTSLTGLTFDEAWRARVAGDIGGAPCFFLGRDQLVKNKRVLGRPRDLADLEALGE